MPQESVGIWNEKLSFPHNVINGLNFGGGTLIKTLVNKSQMTGYHHIEWNGVDLNNKTVSSGVYIYKLNTGDHSLTSKCVFLK